MLILILFILFLSAIIYFLEKKERESNNRFNENFIIPDKINDIENENSLFHWKKNNECYGDIPVIGSSCNKIPVFPKGLEPNETIDQVERKKIFNKLVPKNGKYTFMIPELKYDGIFSRNLDGNNKCCWSLKPTKPTEQKTYGVNNYFHIPKEELIGKTIIEEPECAGMETGYPPIICSN